MAVKDDARSLIHRSVLGFIASKLRSYKKSLRTLRRISPMASAKAYLPPSVFQNP
ncbi:hypothetical protein C4K37_4993 [Pseudomonas chlororaphis subsp. piscium]|uniref:Uncharacterized protein n=1 Tax=Pseudomonas chlororaphis TaxID=587753 RepID=A0AAX3FT96_9PSED|nr:hypothetical protein C4K37_4993 [Pseudomonas chlororaphis subsp. piscium]VEF73825.1 Uncharacterised protein [Pseudomonas chlororaphis]AZC45910.1 hypothetical protein C4K36_5007 [Pseudomonas chlororaphis subsp. piscium]AZC52643.1 hypothetical protein C4K35_5082 [Pseudomonas chlororaphis subsp. piscium]AZC65226.1 hypothetical protein C4K33_4756 [Pseudomonas chlororaphis subsp. piscium]